MKRMLVAVIALAVLGLAVATAGVTMAQEGDSAVETFWGKVAAKLGISEDKLKAAIDETQSEMIDEAVAQGRLTEEQAARLKERGMGMEFGFPGRMPHPGLQIMNAAAEALGMTPAELMAELKDGKTLAEVAEAKGMSVDDLKAKLLAQARTQLDSLVAEGKLTQEQADRIFKQTESNIDDIVNGEAGPCGGFGGRHGPRGGFGPWFGPSPEKTPTSSSTTTTTGLPQITQ